MTVCWLAFVVAFAHFFVGILGDVTVEKELIIPNPPWPYAHVCSLAEMNDGSLVATWQAGSGEKHNDSSIWTATKFTSESSWSYPKIAVTLNGTCIMNAIMYRNTSDVLHMTGHYGGGTNGECLINSWKMLPFHRDPVTLEWQFDGIPHPSWVMGSVKNQCVRLSERFNDNDLDEYVLCPSSYESPDRDTSHFESTNGEMTYFELHNNMTAPPESPCNDMIQPLIFLPADPMKGIFALFRSDCEVAAQAWSLDPFGTKWPSSAEKSTLMNPNSGIGGTTMGPSWWILTFNNATDQRTPLTLAQSLDEGLNWEHLVDIETDSGEFSYPFVIQSRFHRNKAYMCYTYSPTGGERTIAFATLTFS